MKTAYLILAHNTPNHLQRLINALDSSLSYFFIHIDKKSNIDEYANIRGNNISFLEKRISVFWGDFSQVEAILLLLKNAYIYDDKFQRFILLSGSDYPLKSISYINHFFENHSDKEFINFVSIPSKEAGKPISRLTTYNPSFEDKKIPKIIKKILIKSISLLYSRDYKKYFRNLNPYAGSTWWALSREACSYILAFIDEEKEIVQFFKNTFSPDEMFFQTILGNSPFVSNIVRNVTFTDWCSGNSSPNNITFQHLELFTFDNVVSKDAYGDGEMLFAHKFPDDSKQLTSIIDKDIRSLQ